MQRDDKLKPISESILKKLRQQAEQLLSDGQAGQVNFSAATFAELLQELNVYHVELELQNEELRQMRQALEQSQRHFHDIFAHAPVPYLVLDEHGNAVDVNEKALDIFFREHQLAKERFRSHIPAEHYFLFNKTFQRALETEQRQECEIELLNAKGQRFWTMAVMSALPGADNGGNLVLCALVDLSERRAAQQLQERLNEELAQRVESKTAELSREIEERKQIETLLRESEGLARTLLNAAIEPAFLIDPSGRLLAGNQQGAMLCGRSASALEGMSLRDLLGAEAAATLEAEFNAALASAADRHFEVGDAERHFAAVMAPVADAAGRIGRVALYLRDTTTERRVRQALEASEQMHRTVADHIPGGLVALLGADMRFAVARGAALKGLGFDERAFAGKTIRESLPQDAAESIEAVTRKALASQDADCQIALGGRTFMVRGAPLAGGEGLPVQALLLFQDITPLKNVQSELTLAKNAAEAANKAKSAFLANMSHEIRTPISGIMGLTDLMLSRNARPEDGATLQLLKKSANDLLAIVSDILDLSRIEAGKLRLGKESFSPRELADELLSLFRPMAEEKRLGLEVELDPAVPGKVHGDPLRISQVLRNLVSNAIKFTSAGSVSIRVRLKERHSDDAIVLFEVQDTGPGIAPELQPLLFQSFSQLDDSSSKSFAGTGLGLSISRELCRLMNGVIWYDGGPGQGSTFSFLLPLEVDASSDAAGTASARQRSSLPRLDALKVLLAEDNPINQMFISHLLGQAGCEVVVAANGLEALQALRQGPIDMVLMDIQMPELDGLAAARLIRADSSGDFDPHVPVIALTAYAMDNDRERIMAAGMDAYLTKPIDFMKLFSAIEQLAGRSGRPAQAPRPAARPSTGTVPPSPCNDSALSCRLIRMYVEEVPNILSNLSSTSNAIDMSGLSSIAHQLKSTSRLVGASNVATLADMLESAARDKCRETATALCQALASELPKAARLLEGK